jgi:hypothetical protein
MKIRFGQRGRAGFAALALALVIPAGAVIGQQTADPKPNIAFGQISVLIQLPANPGLPFTCANLNEALTAADGSGKVQAFEGPVKVGVNACQAKFKAQVGKQYTINVAPTGVTCPVGKKLDFDLKWQTPTTVKLTQAGQNLLRQGSVTTVACVQTLP